MMNLKKVISILPVIVLMLFSACVSIEEELPPLAESELKVLKIMGGKVLPDGNLAIGKITIHRRGDYISFPGIVNLTEGDLEVLISTPTGRAHESLIVSDIDPYNLQLALLLMGAENGMRSMPDPEKKDEDNKNSGLTQGTLLDIIVKTKDMEEFPVEQWLMNKKTKLEKVQEGWVFVGSSFSSDKKCLASEEGNIANVWTFGNTILDNQSKTGDTDDIFVAYTKRMFPYETPVNIVVRKREKN